VMQMIKNTPLDFPPGTRQQYSNGGYFLLASIIEKASGRSFDDFMNTNVFKKAKMTSSGVDHNDLVTANKAKGYVYENNNKVPGPYDSMDGVMGAGNIYSSANDIYNYYLPLNDTLFLSKRSRQQFRTPVKVRYAYGVTSDTFQKQTCSDNPGGVTGFKSDITMYFNDNAL